MSPRARAVAIPAGGFRGIAVLRLSSLGDVVLTLPVVEALRARWPEARVHYWVKEEFADVVRHHPAIDHVRELERDARRIEDLVSMSAELEDCDLLVDLHVSFRTRVLTWRQRAAVLRAPSDRLQRERWVRARWTRPRPARPVLARYAAALAPLGMTAAGVPRAHAGAEAEAWAGAWWAAWAPAGPVVALAPGARHATKQWPVAHWAALDAALASRGVARLWCSSPAERKAMSALATAVEAGGGRWVCEPLPRVMALLARCGQAVANDSGVMHLAAACGVRVVALFGSTTPELGFAPAGDGHAVLRRREPCQPCTLHGRDRCPLGHFRCMQELAPGQVLAALGH